MMEHSDKCRSAAAQFDRMDNLSRDAALSELRSKLESILEGIQQEQNDRLHEECVMMGLGPKDYAGNGGGL